jgi:hypothetical protein
LSVDRQDFMFGRSNICVAEPRERVAVPAQCQLGRPPEKGDLLAFCMSDMTKIKSNLVTFVTDSFLLLSIVGNHRFSCAQVARTAGPRIERGNEKGDDATTVEATGADLRRSAKTRVGDCKYECPTSPRRRLPRWPRGVFVAPGPTRRTIRVMTSGYVNNDAFGQAVVLTAARP